MDIFNDSEHMVELTRGKIPNNLYLDIYRYTNSGICTDHVELNVTKEQIKEIACNLMQAVHSYELEEVLGLNNGTI